MAETVGFQTELYVLFKSIDGVIWGQHINVPIFYMSQNRLLVFPD